MGENSDCRLLKRGVLRLVGSPGPPSVPVLPWMRRLRSQRYNRWCGPLGGDGVPDGDRRVYPHEWWRSETDLGLGPREGSRPTVPVQDPCVGPRGFSDFLISTGGFGGWVRTRCRHCH